LRCEEDISLDILRKDGIDVSGQTRRDEQAATTLGEDTEFKGTLKFGKTLKIAGKFEGDLTTNGMLIIANTGEIKAEMKVGSVIIEGKAHGNINANDLVELRNPAELYGDIVSARLKIDEGVIFVGKSDVRPKDKAIDREKQSKAEDKKQQQQEQLGEKKG